MAVAECIAAAVAVAVARVRFVPFDKVEEHVVEQLLEDGLQDEGHSVEPWGRQAWQVWGAQ